MSQAEMHIGPETEHGSWGQPFAQVISQKSLPVLRLAFLPRSQSHTATQHNVPASCSSTHQVPLRQTAPKVPRRRKKRKEKKTKQKPPPWNARHKQIPSFPKSLLQFLKSIYKIWGVERQSCG